MADYREMYGKLFNKITDVIGELQQIQRQMEDMYIQSDEVEIVLLKPQTQEQAEMLKTKRTLQK